MRCVPKSYKERAFINFRAKSYRGDSMQKWTKFDDLRRRVSIVSLAADYFGALRFDLTFSSNSVGWGPWRSFESYSKAPIHPLRAKHSSTGSLARALGTPGKHEKSLIKTTSLSLEGIPKTKYSVLNVRWLSFRFEIGINIDLSQGCAMRQRFQKTASQRLNYQLLKLW